MSCLIVPSFGMIALHLANILARCFWTHQRQFLNMPFLSFETRCSTCWGVHWAAILRWIILVSQAEKRGLIPSCLLSHNMSQSCSFTTCYALCTILDDEFYHNINDLIGQQDWSSWKHIPFRTLKRPKFPSLHWRNHRVFPIFYCLNPSILNPFAAISKNGDPPAPRVRFLGFLAIKLELESQKPTRA